MAPIPTARGVAARAVATVRTHWRPILLVALVVYVPVGLLEVLDERAAEADKNDAFGSLGLGLALGATELFGEIMLAGAIVAAIGELDGPRDERSLGRVLVEIPYGRLVAITVISVAAFAIGFILLVVPAIVFLWRFGLASPVAEVEDVGVRAAFRRSYELTGGHFWLVLGVLVPLTLLSTALGQGVQEGGIALLGHSLVGEWAGAVVGDIIISTPWALAAVALVYELKAAEGAGARPARSPSSRPPRP